MIGMYASETAEKGAEMSPAQVCRALIDDLNEMYADLGTIRAQCFLLTTALFCFVLLTIFNWCFTEHNRWRQRCTGKTDTCTGTPPLPEILDKNGDLVSHDWQIRQLRLMRRKVTIQSSFRKHMSILRQLKARADGIKVNEEDEGFIDHQPRPLPPTPSRVSSPQKVLLSKMNSNASSSLCTVPDSPTARNIVLADVESIGAITSIGSVPPDLTNYHDDMSPPASPNDPDSLSNKISYGRPTRFLEAQPSVNYSRPFAFHAIVDSRNQPLSRSLNMRQRQTLRRTATMNSPQHFANRATSMRRSRVCSDSSTATNPSLRTFTSTASPLLRTGTVADDQPLNSAVELNSPMVARLKQHTPAHPSHSAGV